MLPPLNRRLATDLLNKAGIAPHEPLVHLLLQTSALACALPWVRGLALDPGDRGGGPGRASRARVVVDPPAQPGPAYLHMAIHPYPVELEGQLTLPDGTKLAMRPIRPEDAELERRFVAGLSETTRYYRFFYRLHELTPAMLGRFTQVDYDRELALLALAPDARGAPAASPSSRIARYIANLDHESAEFAIVVANAWQGRGVAHAAHEGAHRRAHRRTGGGGGGGGERRRPLRHAAFLARNGLHGPRRSGRSESRSSRARASLTSELTPWRMAEA